MNPEEWNDDHLREILAKHPAFEPNEQVKQEHISRALEAFEQKYQKNVFSTQGNDFSRRLTGTINQTGRVFMSVISGKHRASVAFASLAVAAIGITTLMHTTGVGLNDTFTDISATLGNESAPKKKLVDDRKMQGIAKQDFAAAPTLPPPVIDLSPSPIMPPAAEMAASPPIQIVNEKAPTMASRAYDLPPTPMMPRDADMTASRERSQSLMGASGAPLYAAPGVAVMPDDYPQPPMYQGNDRFEQVAENPVKSVAAEPVSTFSIDVDTASYSFVRRQISQGSLPAPDAVRIEEMINYFPYNYPLPESRRAPFKPTVAVYPTPWNADTKLLHIGIKGYDIAREVAPKSNLVFLIDTSGSMQGPDRLPLLVNCMKMLLENLREDDTVGIVTYAGWTGVALEPTPMRDKAKILDVLNRLYSGGSTAGAQGIETAYQLAQKNFDSEAVNRVVLATDGDFNVGVSDPEQLKRIIEQKRKSGIFLSVLGFGEGNYNDALMQKLAQNGNGTAAYIDTLSEGRKVLVEEATSALFPIAKDVKVQIEFNPAQVAEYRLIGYETRHLNREDFNNDKIDAGELGAGHTVTAIYEIIPAGSKARMVDNLRYGKEQAEVAKPVMGSDEIAFLKLRYKLPSEDTSRLMERPITKADEAGNITGESDDIRFAAAVAAFGQKLKGSPYISDYGYDAIVSLANGACGKDTFGYRAEFVNLVRLAASQTGAVSSQPQPVPEPTPVPMGAPGVAPGGAPGMEPSDPVYYQTR